MSDCEAWEQCCVDSCPAPPTRQITWRTKSRSGYVDVHSMWTCDEHQGQILGTIDDTVEGMVVLPWQSPGTPTSVPWGRIAQDEQ